MYQKNEASTFNSSKVTIWTDTQTDTHRFDWNYYLSAYADGKLQYCFSEAMWFWATYFSVCVKFKDRMFHLTEPWSPFLNPIILQNGSRVNKQLIFRWNSIFRNTNLFLVTTRLFIEPSCPLSLLGPFMSCVYSTSFWDNAASINGKELLRINVTIPTNAYLAIHLAAHLNTIYNQYQFSFQPLSPLPYSTGKSIIVTEHLENILVFPRSLWGTWIFLL